MIINPTELLNIELKVCINVDNKVKVQMQATSDNKHNSI